MNVFDYLKWRDDIDLTELNEVDVLIFNRMSYFPLEKIMNSNESLTIEESYNRLKDNKDIHYSNKFDKLLFEQISKSVRYKDLIIERVIEKFSKENEEQFMALTIDLGKTLFISFRGTTSNIVGWKEDFNMSFMDEVPAQKDALEYINNIKGNKKIYLGGHSKGGNLAVYAGINSNILVKRKIIKIYNYDGPGFMNLTDSYNKIKYKIISYIPQTSVVGRLMNSNNETIIVKSDAKAIMQHNLYSWQVEKKSFIKDTLTEESNNIDKIITNWINNMDIESRKDFINQTYELIKSTGVERIQDLKLTDFKNIVLSYKNMSEESKKDLFKVLSLLFDTTKENIKENFNK